MTIQSRESVRAAVERALQLDPDPQAAAEVVAQTLCLPAEVVLAVINEETEA